MFVESSLAEFIRFDGVVFIELLESRSHLIPGIAHSNRRFKALDTRAQCVNGPSLMAISCVSFVFASSVSLLLNPLEDKVEDVWINICCPTIRSRNKLELFKGCLGCNLIVFVL